MASNSDTPAIPPVEADPERRRGELQRWRRRSRAVHFWRRALPGVIVGVVVLLGVWIGGRTVIIKLTTPPKPPPATGLRMLNPRFYGRDKSNNAFVLGASEAARDSAGSKSVVLSAPHLTLGGGDDATRVHADHGVYHEDQRQLSLDGQVQIHSSSGYTFSTPNAVVDTSKGEVQGDSGIEGEGPLGHIAASSYGVYDRGKRIVMKGDVHAHIVQ
jgi:lipopolysaccharide export system protein LptC